MDPRHLKISDYTYVLPDDRIAAHPLPDRDAARLLRYHNGEIEDHHFTDLPALLPAQTLLLFNETKVLPARLYFRKRTGGLIEIFCLEPDARYPDITTALAQRGEVFWRCLIGKAGKWVPGLTLEHEVEEPTLRATITGRDEKAFLVRLSWDHAALSFAEILERAGEIPLPPYLRRRAESTDRERYQTLFAKHKGSVAAPTASLHFTPRVMEGLAARGVQHGFLILHVGAGTFLPVKSETMNGHAMHAEWLAVTRATLKALLGAVSSQQPVMPVGTTALRTAESLYWIGAALARGSEPDWTGVAVPQWTPYEAGAHVPAHAALAAVLEWMDRRGMSTIGARTELLIAPGYTFRVASGLITNFHQPASTLLLLVAALIGEDWRQVYAHALERGYRFLSYGDGSLLWKKSRN